MTSEITGVLCCYNSALFIEKTLDSIFQQTVSLGELVIIDDCSQDGTVNIIREYLRVKNLGGANVRIYENPCNLGTSLSYNIGIKSCKSRYALLLSHDDINHPERVASTLDAFSQGTSIVCSYMSMPATGVDVLVPSSSAEIALGMAIGNIIPGPTVALEVSVAKKHKLYFNPQYDDAEDYDLWCKCILAGLTFHVIPRHLVSYTAHDKQVSVLRKEEQKIIADKIRFDYLHVLFPFVNAEQGEIFVKVVLFHRHLIASLDRSFGEHISLLIEKRQKGDGVRLLYEYVAQVLLTP
jgi:glycosyltransferase involved in cell wall biosynthesis